MKLQTIKIWDETRKTLKLLAALRDCSMTKVLDDLVKEALSLETQSAQDRAKTQ